MISRTVLILAMMFFSLTASPGELRFLSNDFPPYTYQTDKGGAGVIYEVLTEISRRLGYKNSVEFVPWPRARFEAEHNPDIAIIPLARTKEREDKYVWLIHVLDDPYVLVTLKNSPVNISTIESAKKVKIGILSGSVADALLRELGFTNLETATNDIQNVKKLKLGRIDAWVAPMSCIGEYKNDTGLDKSDLRIGIELTKIHEYVGASKTLDKETISKWQKTFQEMKKDGTYQKILKKYGITPLP